MYSKRIFLSGKKMQWNVEDSYGGEQVLVVKTRVFGCCEKETTINFMSIVYLGTACTRCSNCVIIRCARSLSSASKRCMTTFVCSGAATLNCPPRLKNRKMRDD